MLRQAADGVLNEQKSAASLRNSSDYSISRTEYSKGRVIFRQGDPADSVFYLHQGVVELSVTSQDGNEVIFATLGSGDFFGEECLSAQQERTATATTTTESTIARIDKCRMSRILLEQEEFRESFIKHLLSRMIRYEADIVDQLFNSSEKRLARTLLMLSHLGNRSYREATIPQINQEDLAKMVGTTRSRISHFMYGFKKRGFIDYDRKGITVKSGIYSVLGNTQLSCDSVFSDREYSGKNLMESKTEGRQQREKANYATA